MHVRHCETLKVLDVAREDTKAGATVIIYDLNLESKDNQLWYEDQTGAIRSKLNDFLLTASSKRMQLQPSVCVCKYLNANKTSYFHKYLV